MPKIETFDWIVPGSPEEVAERLEGKTRFRLFPHVGTWLFVQNTPLGGRVTKGGFQVSLNQRDLLQRMQPVARATLEARGGSTRIVGEAGMPPFMVWYLRLAFVAIAAISVGLGANGIIAGAPASEVAMVALLPLLVGGVLGGASIGYHVSHADEQVKQLVDTVATAVGATAQSSSGVSAAQRLPREQPAAETSASRPAAETGTEDPV